MSILVAGLGNVFRGDDAFGVEVLALMARAPMPDGVRLVDFGIRGLHLAFDLLDPPDLLIVVDAVKRGGEPGTVFVLDPSEWQAEAAEEDGHALDLPAALDMLESLGGKRPVMRIVGCEPACVDERIGLSPEVEAALEPAAEAVTRLIAEFSEREVSLVH
jgi:hydrogenase maturation protease